MTGLDLERLLSQTFAQLGPTAYAIAFALVFVQTANPIGAVVPGSPTVFILGLLGRTTEGVSAGLLFGVLSLAAFSGALAGYKSGAWVGPRAFESPRVSSFKPRLENFFDQHGAKAVAIAFFLPFIRCFMPLFAGASQMKRGPFVAFSALGAFAWIGVFLAAGFLFGEFPLIRRNLDTAILLIGLLVGVKILIESRRQRILATTDRA